MLNKFILKILLLSLVVCLNINANATTLAQLYEVAVPVFSQSSKERKKATSKAFEELLIRITGKRDVIGLASGQALLAKSRRYVRSFRYEMLPPPEVFDDENENPSAEESPEIEEKPYPTQKLIVTFDEKAVKNALWKHKLPVWGKIRPNILLWVAIQDSEQRIMLDSTESSEVLSLIQQHAEKRGVPLFYPKLDQADQKNVNVTDVWGGYKEPVINASERYKVNAIISARFEQNETGIWQTRWYLYQGSDESQWQVDAPHLNVVVNEGVDKLASILAERYAHVSSGDDENKILLYVGDVSNLADYEKINRYIASLSAVKSAELAQIQSNELVYQLELRSNPKALKRAIALGKTLLAQDDPFAVELDSNRLNYRLVP